MTYKYFGAVTHIDGVAKLTRLGQPVILEESFGAVAAKGGAAILPADLYDSIGITSEEETLYPTPADAFCAPEEFLRKRDRASELREQWLSGELTTQTEE